MPLVVLRAEITNPQVLKGIKRRWPSVVRISLRGAARYWLEKLFHRHFTPGNETRYHHESRSRFYKQVIKKIEGVGQGKYVDDLLSGMSMRWLWSRTSVTATQHQATIRMRGPAYFSNPYIGKVNKEIPDKRNPGRLRKIVINITRQPDKVRELTDVPDADRDDIQRYLESRMNQLANLALFKP